MALGMRVHMVSCHSGYATFYSTVYERSRVSHVYAHIPICTYPRNRFLAHMHVAHKHARTALCACIASCLRERMSALLFCNILVSDSHHVREQRAYAMALRKAPPRRDAFVIITEQKADPPHAVAQNPLH